MRTSLLAAMMCFLLQRCRVGGTRRRPAFAHRGHHWQRMLPSTTECFNANSIAAPFAGASPWMEATGARSASRIAASAGGFDNGESEPPTPDQRPRATSSSSAPSPHILSTRAHYQFRPLAPGSSRRMPPTISDYDSYDVGDGDETDVELEDLYGMKDDPYAAGSDAPNGRGGVEPRVMPSEQSAGQVEAETEYEVNAASNAPLSFREVMETGTTEPPAVDAAQSTPPQAETVVAPKRAAETGPPPRPRAIPRTTPAFLEPEKTKAVIAPEDGEGGADAPRKLPTEASNGASGTSHLTSLSHQLEHLAQQIYKLNDGVEFNVNSPKQVARVLFGEDNTGDSSTNKDVLEAMASAGNEMAACIYKYRKLSREVKREERRMKQAEKGDRKNDYYGNLAKQDARKAIANGAEQEDVDASSGNDQGGDEADAKIFETAATAAQEAGVNGAKAMDEERRREPLLLIDASAYIYRSYHAIPPLHRSDGTPTGALHGVCRMLQNLLLARLLKGERPRVVLAFDSKGPNFRHDVYPEYKANRGPCPEDLVPQFELVREACGAFGVVQVEAEGFEADDVIATLTRQALEEGVDVDILSGDKDLMQLITPPGAGPMVHMIDPMHFDRVDHDDVVQKWGVSSGKLGDVLALAGDSSDNIPGVPGIGPKIAATLINEYGTLSALIEQADRIKQKKRRESLIENAEKVMLFRKLVTLDESIPMSKMTSSTSFQDVSALRMSSFDPNRLIEYYQLMELNSLHNQLESRLRSSWVNFKPPPTPEEYESVPF